MARYYISFYNLDNIPLDLRTTSTVPEWRWAEPEPDKRVLWPMLACLPEFSKYDFIRESISGERLGFQNCLGTRSFVTMSGGESSADLARAGLSADHGPGLWVDREEFVQLVGSLEVAAKENKFRDAPERMRARLG